MIHGIIVDNQDDIAIENGAMNIGGRKMQDAYISLSINQGELKSAPVVGANLIRMIRGSERIEKIRKVIEITLEGVDVKFDDIKSQFDLFINKSKKM